MLRYAALALLSVGTAAAEGSAGDPATAPAAEGTAATETHVDGYGWQAWTTRDGLPQNSVSSIVQTRDGYLWLGTFGGLARFDGVRFKTFDLSNTEALGSNRILSLCEDRSGTLWIGTQGAGVVRLRDGVFTACRDQPHAPPGNVVAITEDHAGTVWFGGRGLTKYVAGGFEAAGPDEWSAAVTQVWSLCSDREGRLWAAGSGGLARLASGEWRVFGVADGLAASALQLVHEDADGLIWTSGAGGVHHLEGERFDESVLPDVQRHGFAVAICDRRGREWIGGGKGLSFRRVIEDSSAGAGRRTLFERAIESTLVGNVRALLEDREGNVWVGSDTSGLLRARAEFFGRVALPPAARYISPVVFADDGAAGHWILLGGSVWHVEGDDWNELPRASGVHSVKFIASNGDGALWITHDGGRRVACVRAGRTTQIEGQFDFITAILVDRGGTLWISSRDGLSTVRDGHTETVTPADGLLPGGAGTLAESRDGAIWLGGDGVLTRYLGGEFEHYTLADGLARGRIRSIHESGDGKLWIATYGGGLARWDDGRITTFGVHDGLSDNSLGKIIEDDAGNLWINANRGVIRVGLDELNAFAAGRQSSVSSRLFRSGEAGGQHGLRLLDGRLLFPSLDGLITIDPSKASANQVPPPTVIEALAASGLAFDISKSVALPADRRDVVIDYTGLSFVDPGEASFRYRLLGYDDEWVDVGPRRSAHFTNLPPGSYEFQVQARNADLVRSAAVATLDISVAAYFYETAWFFALCGLGVIVAGVAGHRGRTRAILARNEVLRESELRLRLTLDAVSDGGWDWNLATDEVAYSDRWIESLGYTRDEVEPHLSFWESIVDPADLATTRALVAAHLAGHTPYYVCENRLRTKSGAYRWNLDRGRVVARSSDGTPLRMVGTDTDISDLKRVEQEVEQKEQQLDNLLSNVGAIVLEGDPFDIYYVGGQVERILGFPRELWFEDPDGPTGFWGKHLHPDDAGEFETCRRAIELGRDHTFEYRMIAADGREVWFYDTITVETKAGKPVRTRSVMVDISAGKQAELERVGLEAQLRQSQKMEAIGQLAGGVAHDFNNILTAILGNVELGIREATDALGSGHEAVRSMEEIERSAQRAAALTRQLLTFSRRDVMQPRVLNLNDILTNLDGMLRHLITAEITLETSAEPALHCVRADAGQLEQVIVNLVVNAADAMPAGGKLTLQTRNVTCDEDHANHHADARPGPYVVLAVADTGHGMSAATRERIFEPFFTTKPVDKGTGLGLATVHGIVKQSGAHVVVHSEPRQGSTFEVYFPAVEAAPDAQQCGAGAGAPVLAGGHETVLLCEDDESVRMLITHCLRGAGYTVMSAGTGQEGLDLVASSGASNGASIDLLITDVIMPDMNGKALAERLQPTLRGAPTIFISGYTASVIAEHGVLDEGVEFLEKPFRLQKLLEKVRAVLDGGRPA
jgi:PAS domain S-box-containing protein